MAKQVINTGAVANDNTGDPVRTAFTKTNANFTELYNRLDIPTVAGQANRFLTNNGSTLSWSAVADATGDISLTALSVTTAAASGSGSLVYNNATGAFTFTPPDLSGLSGGGSSWDGTTISDHLIPDTDITYDLGSATNRFRDLYLSGNTITLGDATISSTVGGGISVPGGISAASITVPSGWKTVIGILDYASGIARTGNSLDGDVYPIGTPYPIPADEYTGLRPGPYLDGATPRVVYNFDGFEGTATFEFTYDFNGYIETMTVTDAGNEVGILDQFEIGWVPAPTQVLTPKIISAVGAGGPANQTIEIWNDGTKILNYTYDENGTLVSVSGSGWTGADTALDNNRIHVLKLPNDTILDNAPIIGFEEECFAFLQAQVAVIEGTVSATANQTVNTTDSVQFADLTVTGDLTVAGDMHGLNALYLGTMKLSTNDGSTLLVNDSALSGGGGSSFNQSLNTTDSVTFANVSIPGNLSILPGMNFDVQVPLNAFAGISVSTQLDIGSNAPINFTNTTLSIDGDDNFQLSTANRINLEAGNKTWSFIYGDVEEGTIPTLEFPGNLQAAQSQTALFARTGDLSGNWGMTIDAGNSPYSIDIGEINGSNYWRFDGDGNITLPNGGRLESSGLTGALNESIGISVYNDAGSGTIYTLSVAPTGPINIPTASTGLGRLQNPVGLEILTNEGESAKIWTFGADGSITLPNGGKLESNALTGALLVAADTVEIGNSGNIRTNGYNTELYYNVSVNGTLNIDNQGVLAVAAYGDDPTVHLTIDGSPGNGVSITTTPLEGTKQIWKYGSDGRLTFPGSSPFATSGGMTIKNESWNGTTYLDGNGNDIALQVDNTKTIYVKVGGAEWSFGSAGSYPDSTLKLPVGGDIVDSNGVSVLGGGGSSFDQDLNTTDMVSFAGVTTPFVVSEGGLEIGAGYGNDPNATWMFNADGSITFPDSTVQTTAYPGTSYTDADVDSHLMLSLAGDGQVLTYDGAVGGYTWSNHYTNSNVDTHLNFDPTIVTNGQVLTYDAGIGGYTWANAYSNSYVDEHLMLSTASNGQVLTYDDAVAGYKWTTLPGGGTSYTDADVDSHLMLSTASNGQVLTYDDAVAGYKWTTPSSGGGGGMTASIIAAYSTTTEGTYADVSGYKQVKVTGHFGNGVDYTAPYLQIRNSVGSNTGPQVGSGWGKWWRYPGSSYSSDSWAPDLGSYIYMGMNSDALNGYFEVEYTIDGESMYIETKTITSTASLPQQGFQGYYTQNVSGPKYFYFASGTCYNVVIRGYN